MRKTTDEERPEKQTPEERKASHRIDHLERMKERRDELKKRMNEHENTPIQYAHWKKYIARINKRIKDYEDKIKGSIK
jgi:hypothetical protein